MLACTHLTSLEACFVGSPICPRHPNTKTAAIAQDGAFPHESSPSASVGRPSLGVTFVAVLSACVATSVGRRKTRRWTSFGRQAVVVRRASNNTSVAKLPGALGAHALVWSGGLTEEDIRRAATGAAAAGFNMLEVPLLDPDGVDTEMTRRVIEENGLSASASLGLPFDADISSEDADVVARGVARLERCLGLASAFGCKHLCGILYSAFGKYAAPPTEAGRDNAVLSIRRVASRAAELRMQLNLEVVNRYETNLLNTAAQAVDFCEDVNEPNVKIHLDTYHMNIEEKSFAEAVETCGNKLGYVHIGESHRGYLGTGTVQWREFFSTLRKVGYAGPMTFESFSNKVVAPYCVDALCVWRNTWDDSDELARSAREFIGERWERAV